MDVMSQGGVQTCPLARVFACYRGQNSAVDPLPVLLLGQEDSLKSNVYGHSRVVWRRARVGVVKKRLAGGEQLDGT